MGSLHGDEKGEMTAAAVEHRVRCIDRHAPRRFSRRRLKSLLLVTVAVTTFALACLRLALYEAGREHAAATAGETLRVVVPAAGVRSEGFHARRRAMAPIAWRGRRALAAQELAGFVFEEASSEGERNSGSSLRAAALFAAAGAPVLVLDGADDVKDTIRRCARRDGCDSADTTSEIRARVAELVMEGAAQPPASSSGTGYSSSSSAPSGGPADGIAGDDTLLDPEFSWTGGGETEMQGESQVVPWGRYGGSLDSEQRAGVAEEVPCPATAAAAKPGEVDERVEDRVHEEVQHCGTDRGQGTPAGYPEGGATQCGGADGVKEDTGTFPRRFWGEEAGGAGVRGGGIEEDRSSIGQTSLSSGAGGTSGDAEASAVVFALSGWEVDEVEALFEAFPRTPSLYLYREHDGSSQPCHQNRSAATVTATRLLSRPPDSAEVVVLESSSLTAAAAARVLTRFFGVKLRPVGELLMAELYARHGLEEAEPSLDIEAETATASGLGAPWSFSLEDRGCPSEEPCSCWGLRQASAESAKVLGGPFDPTWWWGPGEKTARTVFGDLRQEGDSCQDGGAGGVSGQGWRFHGALGVGGGGDGGTSGTSGGGPQDEGVGGGAAESLPAAAATEAQQERDPLELGAAAASLEGEEVHGQGAWQWQRGLRRMVDIHSPSWMSSEVYSEPVERLLCPDIPGPGYPPEWPLLDLLGNWDLGNASAVPPRHFLGVCRFDYQTELHKARAYGLREVPFVVYNVPELDAAVREWSDPVKLAAALEDHLYSIDVSATNRFLYYGKRSNTADRPPGWTPPTWRIVDTFDSWLQRALGASGNDTDQPPQAVDEGDQSPDQSPERFHGEEHNTGGQSEASRGARVGRRVEGEGEREAAAAAGAEPPGAQRRHYYLKLSSTREKPNRFVDRSLPFFAPRANSSRKTVDDDHDVRPADGDYTAGKKGRRRRTSRQGRWADSEEAWGRHRREQHSWERADGDATASADVSGGLKQQPEEEEEEEEDREEADDGDKVDIFLRDASATKGIHCRLGMDGVMSDGHYDGSRNMVVLLAGKRRWILSHPRNCAHMHMFRKGHPSARHTSADWTDHEVAKHFPRLEKATANEVILRAGEALYVPEHWIHSIVNIGVSAQCNSRSGKSYLYQSIVQECEASARAE